MKKDLLQSDVKICLREVFYAQKYAADAESAAHLRLNLILL